MLADLLSLLFSFALKTHSISFLDLPSASFFSSCEHVFVSMLFFTVTAWAATARCAGAADAVVAAVAAARIPTSRRRRSKPLHGRADVSCGG
jgi:hypothetical protein